MKTLKSLLIITILAAPMLRCSEDTPVEASLYSISGNVTLPGSELAEGALVFLTNSPTATSPLDVTVSNELGAYAFGNLKDGEYYIYSNYNTFNTNSGGRFDGIKFSSESVMVNVAGANATHNVALVNSSAAGVNIKTDDGWRTDKSHSEVVFEFPYREVNGTFSGRFKTYDFIFDFDDSNLGASSITATVSLLSVETGQPGRDGYYTTASKITDPQSPHYTGGDSLDIDGNPVPAWYSSGCLANTIGATSGRGFDTVLSNWESTWTSTSIERYGDGFKAVGNMSFNGNSLPVTVFFTFLDGYSSTNSQGVTTQYSSFEAMFEFKAESEFGISASQVDDVVTVWTSVQVNKVI